MPWSEGPVKDRIELMQRWETGEYTVVELAERAGVTRQCVHKWIRRWKAEGETGMDELSRAPLNPRRTDQGLIEKLLELKHAHPNHGPEKLVTMMSDRQGNLPMAVSTAGKILDGYGLVRRRGRRRDRVGPPSSAPRRPIPGPGHTLTADHKGYFRLGNGRYCYPLTLADPASRYVYAIDAQNRPTIEAAWRVFDRIFGEYGLPDQILTDNGVPFCSARSLGGLTELSKRWIKLGIHVARIDPGRPQQNSVHERMHRTLKQAATRPPQQTLTSQQQHFDAFRYDYNWLRPHKSLELRPPAERLTPFRRSYAGQRSAEIEYPPYFEQRRVRDTGELKIDGERHYLSEVLAREVVGLDCIDQDRSEIYYGSLLLGYYDRRARRIVKADGAQTR
jgi:transposase InsO family protein